MRLLKSMRLLDWKTGAGYLAVIAMLALSVPGVRVVRADEEVGVISVDIVDSGPICQADSKPDSAVSVKVSLGDPSNRREGSVPVALNNEGYSYRPPRVDPEARRLEQR